MQRAPGRWTDRQSAGKRPETLKCGRADLAHFSHTNPTETNRNRTCEKQNEFGFIVSRQPYFLVVDNWERPFALPPSPFLDNFWIADFREAGWTSPVVARALASWLNCL